MVVVLGITVAGCYEVQPLPLQALPFAQPSSVMTGGRRIISKAPKGNRVGATGSKNPRAY